MKYRFLSHARKELEDSVNYYNQQQTGLGYNFAEEVDAVIQRILIDPTSYEKVSDNIYSLRTSRFPYAVFYGLDDESVLIVAVMNLYRKPGYWKNRV